MTLSSWGVIADVVSALCVVISLIYLSLQVRQNTKQMKLQAHKILREEYLKNIDNCTGNKENSEIFIRGLNQFNSMTSIEQASFHSLMHPVVHGFHAVLESNKGGLVSEEDIQAALRQLLSLIITPGGQAWWKSFNHLPPPEIVNFINNSITKYDGQIIPATESIPWYKDSV